MRKWVLSLKRMRIVLVAMLVTMAAVAAACGGSDGAPIDLDAGTSSSSSSSSGGDSAADSNNRIDSASSSSGDARVDAPTQDVVVPDGGPDAGSDGSDGATADADASTDAGQPDADANTDAGPTVTLTVNRTGGAPGTVAWNNGTCGPACNTLSTTHPVGSVVTLTATTANGSDAMFVGFAGGGCAAGGLSRTCTVTLNSDLTIGGRFIMQPANLVFASSITYAGNLGGTAPYDKACNDLATTAGINTLTSDRFIAWVSTNTSAAKDRLGTARGFVRMDAKAFADTQGTLLTANAKIFYPIIHDEKGVSHAGGDVMTGTNHDGVMVPTNCSNFSSAAGTVMAGELGGGPSDWTEEGALSCANPYRILCFGTTMKDVVTPSPVVGNSKTIYLTNTAFAPSVTTPNARCNAEKPPATGGVHAVVSTNGASAASQLNATTLYVRPDGVVVGTGAQISALSELQAGFWLTGNSTYGAFSFWTGAATPTGLGTETCTDWTVANPLANGRLGYSAHSVITGVWSYGIVPCDEAVRFLCVEN
jgi:hypothetical protein